MMAVGAGVLEARRAVCGQRLEREETTQTLMASVVGLSICRGAASDNVGVQARETASVNLEDGRDSEAK